MERPAKEAVEQRTKYFWCKTLGELAVKVIADRPPTEKGAVPVSQPDSPAEISAPGWKQIVGRAISESARDNISLVAAGVAFYSFLAIVPLMGATVLTYGFFARPDTVVKNVEALTVIAPANIAKTIGDLLIGVVRSSGHKKGLGIFLALAVALWGARNAAGSIMIALNIAYEEEEKRSLVRTTLIALVMTLGLVALGLAAVVAMGVLHYLQNLWPRSSDEAALIGGLLTYPLLGTGAAVTAAAIYRYGPSRPIAKWRWLSPGAVFSAIGWLLTTILFGLYVTRFGNYAATYGALGGAIALLTWIYLSAYVFLFGAQLNSEVERQGAIRTVIEDNPPVAALTGTNGLNIKRSLDDIGGRKVALSEPTRELDVLAPHSGSDHRYIVSRLTNRIGGVAGLKRIGLLSSALSTAGLSMIRTKGKARAGAALLGAAAGLAFLGREKD